MAGSIGTIFAELDLDATRYTKGQQKLLQDATTTTLNIEQNFKNLGVKSSAEMDLMRAKITNSFDMIANSSKATANDILRAEKAKSDQLTALNEAQFGKQKSMIDGFKDHWIGATVAMAAAAAAASKGWSMLKLGAEYEEQKGILDNLAKKYSTTSDAMISSMQHATEGLVAKSDLVSIALGGIGKGLNPDQMIKLAGAAEILGDVVGQNTTTAFKELSEALESGRAKALKGYAGTTIDLKEAFGDLESKMNAAEKSQAMYALIMIHATKLQKEQTGEVSTTADEIERLEAKYKDITLSIDTAFMTAVVKTDNFLARYGRGSMNPLNIGANFLASFFEKKATTGPGVYEVPEIGKPAKADPVTEYQNQIAKLRELLQAKKDNEDAEKASASTAEAAAKAIESAINQVTEETRKAYYEIDGMGKSQYDKDLARIESDAKKWKEKTNNDVSVSQWKAAQIALAEAKQAEETTKFWQKSGLDAEEAMKKEVEVGMYQTAESIKRIKERREAERELYKDLRGYEIEAYAASMALIDEQAKKYRDLGVSEIAVSAWVTEETRKAEYKKAEYSNDFFEGVSAELKKVKSEMTSWGKVGIDTVKSFSSNSQKSMSTLFFDVYKRDLKKAGDYFSDFADSMASDFSKTLSKMVMDSALQSINMSFGATWTSGATAVLGVVGKVLGYAADWMMGSGGESSDGTWSFAQGGWVPGYAYGGNSPANDTVSARLSPGEYVVDRERIAAMGQNGDSMIAHINPAEAALLKALGGAGTINERTGLPQFWGFSDFANALTGGTYDLVTNMISGNYIDGVLHFFTGAFDNPIINAMDDFGTYNATWPIMLANKAGLISDDALVDKINKYTEMAAHAIGSFFAAGGSSLLVEGGTGAAETAATIAADEAGNAAFAATLDEGAAESAAQLAYEEAFYAAMEQSGQGIIKEIALKMVLGYAKKWAINEALGALFPAENGQLGVTLEGMDTGNLGSSMKGNLQSIAPRSDTFAFSAKNGLDYVPRDNFKINAHKGEAVITAEENKKRMSAIYGSEDTNLPPVQVTINIDGKKLAGLLYKQSKAGVKIIHDRGITGV